MVKKVDVTALKFNQASIILFTLLGFLFNQPLLVLLVGLVMAIGTIYPPAALFKWVYLHLFKANKILRPNIIDDDPAPHRFAKGVGALFMLAGSVALFALPGSAVGWVLAWIVIVLAAVNFVFSFCAGCFVYFQLEKFGFISQAKGK